MSIRTMSALLSWAAVLTAGIPASSCIAADTKAAQSATSTETTAAAQAVLTRQFQLPAGKINLEAIPAVEGRDAFEYEAADGKLTVRGSSAVAICRGFYEYMRDHKLAW